jgi:lipopolysaccharide/colanic/teichoic acid biosynthesis glycosyltransferase
MMQRRVRPEGHDRMRRAAVYAGVAVAVTVYVLVLRPLGTMRAAVVSCLALLFATAAFDAVISVLDRPDSRRAPDVTFKVAAGASVPVGPARRALDLCVSTLLLILLAPVLVLIGVAVRTTSRGPALFRQPRIGQGGVPFNMLKFRTMRAGRPVAGPQITVRNDPRITSTGRFLRAMSLDELPQLLNVLAGHMTLVGPRPEAPTLAERYPKTCQYVFRYRPGLTGPVQIHFRDTDALGDESDDPEGFYLREQVPKRVALDAEYLRNPTMGATLKLLDETALHVVKRGIRQFRRKSDDVLIVLPPPEVVVVTETSVVSTEEAKSSHSPQHR